MNFDRHQFTVFLGTVFLFLGVNWSALVAQDVDRDEFFKRMEARAMSLSKKMADISGTEPIQLIKPREKREQMILPERQAPQEYYNALPGPPPQSIEPVDDGSDAVPPSVVYEDPKGDSFSEIKPSIEELKGRYFFRPYMALQAPAEYDARISLGINPVPYSDQMDGDLGYALGIRTGQRLGNLEVSLGFGYHHQEYSNPDFASTSFSSAGECELLSLALGLGYSVPVSEDWSLGFGLDLGTAWRRDSVEVDFTALGFGAFLPPAAYSESDSVFIYDLRVFLDYDFSEDLSMYLGYRLMGVPDNGPFDQVTLHLFEAGIGANF